MGMDLRAPKVTEYLGLADRKGVSNLVLDKSLKISDLIFQVDELPNLDILSSGLIPPNPAELLMSKNIEELFSDLKKDYDYLVVDTAPINLVTDTMLIAKYADMFVYVVRANYLDKRMLEIPQALYTEKRLPNMAVVLNDVNIKRGYGYGYGMDTAMVMEWKKNLGIKKYLRIHKYKKGAIIIAPFLYKTFVVF